MRISDWSSDVCSSDLNPIGIAQQTIALLAAFSDGRGAPIVLDQFRNFGKGVLLARLALPQPHQMPSKARLNRPLPLRPRLRSEARRVGKEWSVRVDLGGRRIIKKKKTYKTLKE